jgi:4-amino-4-deoxy-L-arabinose transferase-like glycosyltransferase
VLSRFLLSLPCPEALTPTGSYHLSDLAVSALMAKHFLERGEFPYFFWGQNWYGGLDALLHAGAFLVFGVSAWAMRMTQLVLYAAYCLLTYLIARDLFSRRAALFALLWCAVPPVLLAEFALVPSTSPLELCVIGSLLIWLTIQAVSSRSARARALLYFGIGCVCGLGWWATPLSIFFLVGCGVFVLVRERWRGLRLGLGLTLPGFLLGALPFIVYYARDPYSQLLGLREGFHWSRLVYGARRLFLELFPALFDLDRFAALFPGTQWAVAALYAYAAGSTFIGIVRGKAGGRAAARPVLLWVFAALVAIYASSSHAERASKHYVVAIFSLAPLAMGYAIAETRRQYRGVAVACFFALLVGQGAVIGEWTARDVATCEGRTGGLLQAVKRVDAAGLTRVYADYDLGSLAMTFFAREKIVFSNLMQERYRPYELLLDGALAPGFLQSGSPDAFVPILGQIGGTGRSLSDGPYNVFYGFEAPKRRYRRIEAGGIQALASHAPGEAANMLDGTMDREWSSGETKADGMWVQFDLGAVRDVGMVRLWNKGENHGNYALDVSLEVSTDGRAWQTALPRLQGEYYYWSGPRLYFWEWGYRMELRFGPVSARYIRIRQYENSSRFPWLINEALFYEDLGPGSDDAAAEGALVQRALDLHLARVYADRWISAKLREAGGSRVQTVEPFSFGIEQFYHRLPSRMVQWDKTTGFVLDESDAGSFEKTLAASGVVMAQEKYGRWRLFFFERWGDREEALKAGPGWWWMGLGVVGANNVPKDGRLF